MYEDGGPAPLLDPVMSESTLTELLLCGEGGGGGSYPGCWTPNIQIGSVHRSGWASLSSKYLTALSRCLVPCLAAIRRAFVFFALVGERGEANCDCDCASRDGKERSVDEAENVWLNQPDRRVGREGEGELV